MPFVFLIIGAVFVVAGVRGTTPQLTQLIKGDFTGKGNFIYWALSILLIGALGYIEDLKPISRAFLILVVIVLILSNKGFFAQFNQQISTTQNTSSTGTQMASTTGVNTSTLQSLASQV